MNLPLVYQTPILEMVDSAFLTAIEGGNAEEIIPIVSGDLYGKKPTEEKINEVLNHFQTSGDPQTVFLISLITTIYYGS